MTLRDGALFLAGLVILTLPILFAAEVPAALWLFIGRPLYAMGVKLDRITAMLDRGND